MDHDVGTMFNGTQEVGGGESIVNDQGQPMIVGDICQGFDISDIQTRVTDTLSEDGFGSVGDCRGKFVVVSGFDEFYRDPELRKNVVKLSKAAAVKVTGGDDFVPGLSQVNDTLEDGAGTGCQCQCCGPPFECGDPLFKHIGCRIHQAGVDVSEFLQGKKVSCVFGVAENIGAGSVDRYAAASCCRVGAVTCVQDLGFNVFAHDASSLLVSC